MTIGYEVRSEVLGPQLTAVVRGEMPIEQMPVWLSEAFATVTDYLGRERIRPVAPPFARFTFLAGTVAVEAGFAVDSEIAGDDRVEASALPEGPAAVTTHLGSYEDVQKAMGAIGDWLLERGLQPAGPHWEVYFTSPNSEPDQAKWRTDVVVPYRSAADSATTA